MLKAYDRTTGKEVKVGDMVTDFRGEQGILLELTRAEGVGYSGKVYVQASNGSKWEVYDNCYNLRVVKE